MKNKSRGMSQALEDFTEIDHALGEIDTWYSHRMQRLEAFAKAMYVVFGGKYQEQLYFKYIFNEAISGRILIREVNSDEDDVIAYIELKDMVKDDFSRGWNIRDEAYEVVLESFRSVDIEEAVEYIDNYLNSDDGDEL